MKKILLFAVLMAAATVYAALISQYPNTATLQGTDLFIVERPGVTNYNISAADLPSALGLPGLFDSLGAGTTAATAATNGFPWGTLYDPANAAHNATNGFPWGSLYDAANAAHNATNGFPWGTLYDPAGAALAATNGLWTSASGVFSTLTQLNFLSNHLNSANLFGLVPAANLGTGTANSTSFLRGDQVYTSTLNISALTTSSGGILNTNTSGGANAITNGGMVLYWTNNTPTLALPDGSVAFVGGQIYTRTNGAWVVAIGGSSGGTSGTNFSGLNVTNAVTYGTLSPFNTWTRHIFWGNSRTAGTGEVPWPADLITNFLMTVPNFAGATNVAVIGKTIEQNNGEYVSLIQPFKPASGTNAYLYYMDVINDVINSTNIQTSINSLSNIITQAHADGFKLVFFTAFEPSGGSKLTQAQLSLLVTLNNYILTNQVIDFRVDVASYWSYFQNNLVQSDQLHPTSLGALIMAQMAWDALHRPAGVSDRPSPEGRFGNFFQVSSIIGGYNDVSLRGLATLTRFSGEFPDLFLDSGSSGASWIGLNAAASGSLSIYTVPDTGNLVERMRINGALLSTTTPASFAGSVTFTNGAICPTNYVAANFAPVSGSVKVAFSNNWAYAITEIATNRIFQINP
jgi:hypothetical protein